MDQHSGENDRYRRTLDSLIEGFQIIGHDWTYLYVNPAAAGHASLRPEDLVGRKVPEVFPGIETTPTYEVLSRCMADRENAAVENLFTFPDGTSRWFEIRVSPVPEGICVRSLDIQEHKETEAAREQMARRLHEQADREIDESMQTIRRLVEEFAADMQNAPGTWSGKARSLADRVAELAAGTALAQRQLEFIASLRRGDSVYVIPFKRDGIVERVRKKHETIVVLVDSKQVEVPFREVSKPDGAR